jgi:hypothetical protein
LDSFGLFDFWTVLDFWTFELLDSFGISVRGLLISVRE